MYVFYRFALWELLEPPPRVGRSDSCAGQNKNKIGALRATGTVLTQMLWLWCSINAQRYVVGSEFVLHANEVAKRKKKQNKSLQVI